MIPTDAIIMIFKYMLETTGEDKAKLSNDTSTLIFENKISHHYHRKQNTKTTELQ